LAINPVAESTIMIRNAETMASETMAIRSDLRRRHASVHRLGETVCGMS
jgi:hypothetical protein